MSGFQLKNHKYIFKLKKTRVYSFHANIVLDPKIFINVNQIYFESLLSKRLNF